MAEIPISAPIDPVRAAYLDMEQRRKRQTRRIPYNAGPVVALQQATAGNSRQADEQPALDYPTDAA